MIVGLFQRLQDATDEFLQIESSVQDYIWHAVCASSYMKFYKLEKPYEDIVKEMKLDDNISQAATTSMGKVSSYIEILTVKGHMLHFL